MNNLIGKTCLVKYDINLMLDTIFTVIDVDEIQQWIKVTPYNRWYRLDSVLLFSDIETLNKVIAQYEELVQVYNEHRQQEKEMREKILKLVSTYNNTTSAN